MRGVAGRGLAGSGRRRCHPAPAPAAAAAAAAATVASDGQYVSSDPL